jgi:hypothetical protein
MHILFRESAWPMPTVCDRQTVRWFSKDMYNVHDCVYVFIYMIYVEKSSITLTLSVYGAVKFPALAMLLRCTLSHATKWTTHDNTHCRKSDHRDTLCRTWYGLLKNQEWRMCGNIPCTSIMDNKRSRDKKKNMQWKYSLSLTHTICLPVVYFVSRSFSHPVCLSLFRFLLSVCLSLILSVCLSLIKR